jgi:hypothetical protein
MGWKRFTKAITNPIKSIANEVTKPLGGWVNVRDSLEAAGAAAGNYFLPGSGLVTSQLVSSGAKEKLGSDLGRLAMLSSGVSGGMAGNLANYGDLGSMFQGADTTANVSSGLNTVNGADIGGAGSSPVNMGAEQPFELSSMTATPTPATPAFDANTVATGSNVPVDYSVGPNASSGTGLQSTGYSSLQGTTNTAGGVSSSLGFGTGPANGISAPTEGYFAGASPSVSSGSNAGFLASLKQGNYGDAAIAAGQKMLDNPVPTLYTAGSLYDMYAKKQMAQQQQQQLDQNRNDILNMYGPDSPEYKLLERELAAKDAAAGRNSQYNSRATDLQARIANMKMQSLAQMQTGQNALNNQRLGNQYGAFNTPLTLAALSATSK